MKFRNKLFVAGLALLAVSGTSCKKSFFDINQDKNSPVESNISPDLVAPAALVNTGNRTTTYSFLNNWLGYWAPGANYAPSTEEQSYAITTSFGSGIFSSIMDNNYDYQFMETSAKKLNMGFYQGIAKIMKSLNYAQLVDVYNNVPYTEALQGLTYVRPKYDDAKAIYEDLIKQIDTGMSLIKASTISDNTNISTTDIMFAADKTKWYKFGNTLKLRLLMHQSNRSDRQSYIQAEIAKIAAEGSGFLGSGEDAAVNPIFASDKPNAYYATFGFTQTGTQATDFWRANVIAMNYLKANGPDPRLGYFYKPVVSGAGTSEPFTQPAPLTYRGNQYGLPINNTTFPYQTANYVSQVGGVTTAGAVTSSSFGLVKGYNQSLWIITSVESLFLQAEAAQKGYITTTTPKAAYMAALKESFLWLNVGQSASAANTSFTSWYNTQVSNDNKSVSYDANTLAADQLRLIMFQKYLAMNGINGLEVWTDYRRYTSGAAQVDPEPTKYAGGVVGTNSYPYLDLSQNPGRTSLILPVRMLYPQRELELNNANVPTAGTKSGDQFTAKIWWMP